MNKKEVFWLHGFLLVFIFHSFALGNLSWGGLEPGTFRTGFRLVSIQDISRFYPNNDSAGLTPRTIRIYIWYPAVESEQTCMKLNDYIKLAVDDFNIPKLEGQRKNIFDVLPVQLQKGVPSEKINNLLNKHTFAKRNIAPKTGKYPLIVFGQGLYYESPLSHFVMCEFLASHGYVVATCPLLGTHYRLVNLNTEDLETQVRDLEFVLGYTKIFPYVNPRKIGLVGYDIGGMAGLILAMRNPTIRAFLSMDSGINFQHHSGLPQTHPSYREERFTIPWMHMTQARFVKYFRDELKKSSLFQRKKYGPSYLVHVPTTNHGCFSSYAVMGIENPLSGYWEIVEKNLDNLHNRICTTVLAFFEGYLKQNQSYINRLYKKTRGKEHSDFSIRFELKPGIVPPPSNAELVNLIINKGVKILKPELERLRNGYPIEEIFDESVINWLGYHFLLWWDRIDEALEVFKLNVWLFPNSANAHDSLAEAYMIVGNMELAIMNYKKSLELNPDNKNTAEKLKKLQQKK